MKNDKCFNFTKEDFRNIRSVISIQAFIRKYEIDKIMEDICENHFDNALELGCGSGRYSKHLAFYCKKLTAIEYNERRLSAKNNEKITFIVGDAQDLSRFGDNEMDLIFSSNLIEHLSDIDRCLAECRRVVKTDGQIIHTVPTRTWKFFHLLLYYPVAIEVLFLKIFSAQKATALLETISPEIDCDSSLRPHDSAFSIKKHLLPKTHGVSKSHYSEFKNWGQKHWINIFKKNGLEILEIVRLPFYFGWEYNFRLILKLGNYLGMSSSTAYILRKNKG
ncbi:Ubiquinone biosynthesis O-methyltransferase, mitochondrial [subsurface metagenome]